MVFENGYVIINCMDPSYNGFGTQTQQSPIMSSGTGDIILDTSGGVKKSKKGWIIGGILGVLVVVAVVVAVIVMTNRKGVSGNEADLAQQYINYIINCNVDDEVNDVQDEENFYYAGIEGTYCLSYQVKYATDEEFAEFYDTANGFLDKMFDGTEGEELTDLILEQQEMLKVFKVYRAVGIYDKADLEYLYFNDQLGEKRQLVNTETTELETDSSDEEDIAKQYLDLVRDYYGKSDLVFGIYDKYECKEVLKYDGGSCNLTEQDYNTWTENFSGLDSLYEDMTDFVNDAMSQYLYLMDEMEGINE